ncbi:hypothetical protein ACTMU2_22255 [Cupriavidus basilensis]
MAPLVSLEYAVQACATDLSRSAALPTARTDEIGALARTFSRVMGELVERTGALLTARKLAEEREARIHAITEPHTGPRCLPRQGRTLRVRQSSSTNSDLASLSMKLSD